MAGLYHTALPGGQISDAEPREWWADRESQAFVHDILQGLPGPMTEADILYADLPWADGYEEFRARAGVPARGKETPILSYSEWLYQLNIILAECGKPWVIVGGRDASRYLGCEWCGRVSLNGSTAWAMGARGHRPPDDIADAVALLEWLSSNPLYETIGDFCAGYGRSAEIFARAGKSFIVSDFNPVCIGHIAREAPAWLSATT